MQRIEPGECVARKQRSNDPLPIAPDHLVLRKAGLEAGSLHGVSGGPLALRLGVNAVPSRNAIARLLARSDVPRSVGNDVYAQRIWHVKRLSLVERRLPAAPGLACPRSWSFRRT